jgi:hypothetical protein
VLKVSEQAVDNVRLRREDVDGIHFRVRLPPLLDLLDVWGSRLARRILRGLDTEAYWQYCG